MTIFSKPRKAATVALIRDSSSLNDIEVLLMKRHPDDRFLPGYHVFPGGAVDENDVPQCRNFDQYIDGLNLDFIEDKINYITHVMCAIRETFEESGILLADSHGTYFSMDAPDVHERFSLYRKKVFKGEISMSQMLLQENLEPSFKSLHYITRWVTPVYSPIRYDTRFFVAISPAEQKTCHDGDELISSEWMTPGDALGKYRKGRMKFVTPTINTLEFLAKFKSTGDAVNYFSDESVSSPARSF